MPAASPAATIEPPDEPAARWNRKPCSSSTEAAPTSAIALTPPPSRTMSRFKRSPQPLEGTGKASAGPRADRPHPPRCAVSRRRQTAGSAWPWPTLAWGSEAPPTGLPLDLPSPLRQVPDYRVRCRASMGCAAALQPARHGLERRLQAPVALHLRLQLADPLLELADLDPEAVG